MRPIIEYSAVIYHTMPTAEQMAYIEKQRTRALKNIYGNDYSQRKLLELSDLPLSTRERRRVLDLQRKLQKTRGLLNTSSKKDREPEPRLNMWNITQEQTEGVTRHTYITEDF